MLLIIGISLYTSRLVLNALGVVDYGIYNIVGGLVTMFGFINGAMSTATQRYFSYDIGSNNKVKLAKTFSACLTVHLFIGLGILLIGETFGLWYVNNKLVFPVERIIAVNVVYQMSLVTLFLSIIQVPYNALILSREHMHVYAYVSILESVLKFLVAYVIVFSVSDKLILYAILTFLLTLIIRLTYQFYCRRHFQESRYQFEYDKVYFKELIFYSGWNLFGTFSLVLKNQGVNLLLNFFFGTIVNAAYGISMQIQVVVTQFISSFQSALNPQIVKNYSSNDREKSLNLIFLGSKFSFTVMQFLAIPIIINTTLILKIWLGDNIPDYTVIFVKISLIVLLIDSISGTLMTGIQATGKIKRYQIIVGSLNLIILPVNYWFLKIGYSPEICFYILLIFSVISIFLRVYFLKSVYDFGIWTFVKKVLFPVMFLAITALLWSFLVSIIWQVNNIWDLFLWAIMFVLFQVGVVLTCLLTNSQRRSVLDFLRRKLKIYKF